jgi:twinkle protein
LSSVPNPKITSNKLQQHHYDWLFKRGISAEVADKMRLFAAEKFFAKSGAMADSIGFPYYRDGALVSAKYRCLNQKDFTQEAGGAHDFFGIDNVKKGEPIVIVEGEMDQLTLMQAGVANAVSVPAGAPIKVVDGKVSPKEDGRFSFVWNARELIDAAPYVIIATDQDGPGQALAEELSRRIGKEKCRLAKFDKKDLNEVLMDDSDLDLDPIEKIKAIIDDATPYPIAGISSAESYKDRIADLFTRGTGKGLSTGYESVDQIYTVAPAQMTVVTGHPSSGKSNWVDQVMVNLARGDGWKFAICSFENQPEIHISRLMEIYTNKRFFDGTGRMSEREKEEAFKWVNDHFIFLDHGGSEPATLDSILLRARAAVQQMGVRGLVIDPYNYIEMEKGDSETQIISSMLSRVQMLCKSTDLHTFFVAHPAKQTRSGTELPRPDGMSISGSMAWWAKTDCGVTIHRRGNSPEVEVAVWKCRYRWVGTQGETTLMYKKDSGTYYEPDFL